MEQLNEFVSNNWELFFALVVIVALLARSYLASGGIKSIRPLEAVGLANHNDAVFVDVRTDDEFRDGHILHSLHAPLGLFDAKIKELNRYKERPLVVYCRSGSRSGRAGSLLKKQGFNEVYNLAGGVMAWQNASLPLTKDNQPPPPPKPNNSSDKVEKSSEVSDKVETDAPAVSSESSSEKTSAANPNVSIEQDHNNVVVYVTRRCPFCVRAIKLLNTKGVDFEEINIENQPALRSEMEQRSQRTSVPQIFIGDYHVGGCDDMVELDRQGQLDSLLGIENNALRAAR